jgi:hypothetical protein
MRHAAEKEMGVSHHIIEQLKVVLGAEGWKAFMGELAAARGRGRDVVVERWLAVARTMKLEQTAAKAKADAEEFDAIGAIVDPYQRANPTLTVEDVIPLLLRDGRAEDADRVLAYCGRTVAT